MTQKVTLLSINAKYVHSSLSVWCLAQAVSQFSRFDHQISVVESTINQPVCDIAAQIAQTRPDVIGISVYIWNARQAETLLESIKQGLRHVKIVVGGPEASYNAAHWLSLGAHFVVAGEGERSFPSLLDAVISNNYAALDEIPGLWRQSCGAPVYTGDALPCDTAVDPYSDAYWQALGGRIAYLETSRGCPFSCAFCLSGGSRLRFFPLDKAKEQLLQLSQSGTRTVKLVDRTFNCNSARAYTLLEYIIGLDTACCFHFEVAADLFDEQTLTLLSTAPAGRIQLEAGLQSFYQPTLDAVARKTNLDSAERNLKALLAGENIHIHVDLIAGLPYETLEIFRQSFNRAYAIGAHTLQLGFLKLLHGSALRRRAVELDLRYNAAPPYEITGSRWLSPADLDIIRQVEHALERIYNSGRFIQTASYALMATGLEPFELYRKLGGAASGYRKPLGGYAGQIFDCLCGLPGIDSQTLRDHMICDWLSAMRGENMPDFLHTNGQNAQIRACAEAFLGRKISRCETMPLGQGGVFIDSSAVHPVTGRYKLYQVSAATGVIV